MFEFSDIHIKYLITKAWALEHCHGVESWVSTVWCQKYNFSWYHVENFAFFSKFGKVLRSIKASFDREVLTTLYSRNKQSFLCTKVLMEMYFQYNRLHSRLCWKYISIWTDLKWTMVWSCSCFRVRPSAHTGSSTGGFSLQDTELLLFWTESRCNGFSGFSFVWKPTCWLNDDDTGSFLCLSA